MVHEMCNFYLRCRHRAASWALIVIRDVPTPTPFFSGNMQFVCCLSSVISASEYGEVCVLSSLDNRCRRGGKMICPAGSRFMVTFSSGF